MVSGSKAVLNFFSGLRDRVEVVKIREKEGAGRVRYNSVVTNLLIVTRKSYAGDGEIKSGLAIGGGISRIAGVAVVNGTYSPTPLG